MRQNTRQERSCSVPTTVTRRTLRGTCSRGTTGGRPWTPHPFFAEREKRSSPASAFAKATADKRGEDLASARSCTI
jgi:hypothetical protein